MVIYYVKRALKFKIGKLTIFRIRKLSQFTLPLKITMGEIYLMR